MLTIFTIVACGAWFAILYPLLRRSLERHVVPLDVSPPLPLILLAASVFTELVFVVNRDDGTAILAQGLSVSNRLMVVITGAAACYVGWQVVRDKRVLALPFAMPYLPFTILILADGLSAAWSVVPPYTAYRAFELAVLFLATVLLFDRNSILRTLPILLSAFIGIWLVLVAPIYAGNLMHGIIFSSAKNNLTPMLCIALFAYALFVEPNGRWRPWQIMLALAGLVIAGSAASTAAIVGIVPAVMIASPRPVVRLAGAIAAAIGVAVFLLLTVNLADFPGLLHFVSTVLQKPEVELANATGRTSIWPALIEATRNHSFGTGFAAGERFPQLLLTEGEVRNLLGDNDINLASAHNMFLSAWMGTGLLGIALALTVLGTAVTWALKLPPGRRRFALSVILALVLNGMTTPGIFSSWNVMVVPFVGTLAFVRIAVGQQARPAPRVALSALRSANLAPEAGTRP